MIGILNKLGWKVATRELALRKPQLILLLLILLLTLLLTLPFEILFLVCPCFRAGSCLCFEFLLFYFLCEKFGALHACNLESNFDLLTLFIAHFIDDFFEDLVIVAMLVSFYT